MRKGTIKSLVADEKSKKKVFITVLNWNGGDHVIQCLESLEKLNYPDYQIVVVDNGSRDDSPRAIKEAFRDITLIENGRNLGFAEGNNIGIRYALESGAHYILILNYDTTVDADVLDALVEEGEKSPQTGVLGPKIYYYSEPNKVWFAGGKIDWKKGGGYHPGMDEDDKSQFSETKEVDFITGCALLAKREVFEKVGLLDSRFFLYYEDTDFCVRAAREGFKVVFVPRARVWHKISSGLGLTSPSIFYYYTRNRLLFMQKHSSPSEWRRFLLRFFYSSYLKHGVAYLFQGKPDFFYAVNQGFFDFWRGRFGERPSQ